MYEKEEKKTELNRQFQLHSAHSAASIKKSEHLQIRTDIVF